MFLLLKQLKVFRILLRFSYRKLPIFHLGISYEQNYQNLMFKKYFCKKISLPHVSRKGVYTPYILFSTTRQRVRLHWNHMLFKMSAYTLKYYTFIMQYRYSKWCTFTVYKIMWAVVCKSWKILFLLYALHTAFPRCITVTIKHAISNNYTLSFFIIRWRSNYCTDIVVYIWYVFVNIVRYTSLY